MKLYQIVMFFMLLIDVGVNKINVWKYMDQNVPTREIMIKPKLFGVTGSCPIFSKDNWYESLEAQSKLCHRPSLS